MEDKHIKKEKINILVLEKNKEEINYICSSIKENQFQYEFICVLSIEEAEKKINEYKIRKKKIDAAILNIEFKSHVDHFSGTERANDLEFKLISNLKTQNFCISIIIYTEGTVVHNVVEALRAGVFDYIIKPVSADFLRERINCAVNKFKLNKLSEMYFHTIIHDLKTPISSFSMLVSTMMMSDFYKKAKDAKLSRYIKVGERAVNIASNMIESILNIEKIKNKRYLIKREKFNIAECINKVLEMFEPILEQEKYNIILELGFNNDFMVITDKNLYEHIFYNLAANCKRYALSDTFVNIKIDCKDNNLITSIKNIGSYISDYNKESIFDKFVQVESTQNTNKNFGLGLTFCKAAVDYLGGEIWINSHKELDIDENAKDMESKLKMQTTFLYSIPIEGDKGEVGSGKREGRSLEYF